MTGAHSTTKLTKRVATMRPSLLARLQQGWSDESAAQIVEFAVSLPLLILFVVGIFDFSNAVSLKQKLTNAAREAARVAASDSANDLASPSTTVPASIGDAFQVADNYLISDNVNDCGLATAAPTAAGLTWTYTAAAGGCPGTGISLAINRGCLTPITTPAGTETLIGTCVTISYAYKWQFNNVASSFGWTPSGPSTINVTAGALNEN
jgi:Flp pilus assembly protein TadG